MSKIARYDGNLQAFGVNATGLNRTVFGDTSQSDALDDNINADYLSGWEIVGVNDKPTKQDFNGLGFTLGQLLSYVHQMGVPEWNVAQEYHTDSVCTYDGRIWISTADGNIGNTPGVSDWVVHLRATDIGTAVQAYNAALDDVVSVRSFGAVGDGVADDTAAIQAAIDSMAGAAPYGSVFFPAGTYKTTSAIQMKKHVNLRGLGGYVSVLNPNGCDGIVYDYTTGYGNSIIRDIGLQGTGTTANVAIRQATTTDEANTLYGLTFDGILILNFNTGIELHTVQDVLINNCWMQDINSGVELIGRCYVVNVKNTKIIKASGSGTGTQYGVIADWYNYTAGSGNVRPETVRIESSTVHGFTTGVRISAAIYAWVTGCDIEATTEGVTFGVVDSVMTIDKNYIEVDGSAGSVTIRGIDNGAVIDNQINIIGNQCLFTGSAAGTTIGILLGYALSTGNVDHAIVRDNLISGATLYDISVYKSGHILISGNKCDSTGVTNSILLNTLQSNRPVYVDNNTCYSTIGYSAADLIPEKLIIGPNIINQTTPIYYSTGEWVDRAFSAGNYSASGSMTWTVASGDVVSDNYLLNGKLLTMSFIVDTSSVGGTPSSDLRISLPGGKTVNAQSTNPIRIVDNGTASIGYALAIPGNGYVSIRRVDLTNWQLSTDNTRVEGQITLEVQ